MSSTDDQTESGQGGRKLRILCLHGFLQTSEVGGKEAPLPSRHALILLTLQQTSQKVEHTLNVGFVVLMKLWEAWEKCDEQVVWWAGMEVRKKHFF
jgi:hypothetical protein